MDRHAGGREIVIADRIHAHHREDAAHHRQLARRAEADGAVALLGDAIEIVRGFEPVPEGGLRGEGLGVHARHQLHQRAVGRHSSRYIADMAAEKAERMSLLETRSEVIARA